MGISKTSAPLPPPDTCHCFTASIYCLVSLSAFVRSDLKRVNVTPCHFFYLFWCNAAAKRSRQLRYTFINKCDAHTHTRTLPFLYGDVFTAALCAFVRWRNFARPFVVNTLVRLGWQGARALFARRDRRGASAEATPAGAAARRAPHRSVSRAPVWSAARTLFMCCTASRLFNDSSVLTRGNSLPSLQHTVATVFTISGQRFTPHFVRVVLQIMSKS